MSPLDGDLLRLLSHMPLLDRMEMAALSGWSGGGVYRAVSRLEDAGLIASVPHGTELIPPTRRFHLTAAGLRRLAHAENTALEGLLRDLPVSARWRRVLLERLDAVAVVYRIAAAISNTAFPVRFQWYRAMPMDAAVTLPGGGVIAIVRQGPTTDRTGFSKRLWRLTQGPQPGCILVLAPDEVRLRHSRRRLSQTHAEALFALEREAAAASPDAPVWRLRSVSAAVSLRAAIDRMDRRGALPTERPLTRAERWNDLFSRVRDWRLELRDRYAVPTDRELHACDLLAGRGKLARNDGADRRLSPRHGAEIFIGGLRVIEDAARTIGGVEIVNVCLRKPDVRGYEQASLDRLLNRINTSVAADGRYAHLIFDEGGERMIRRLYGRLRSRNPVPSKYEAWEDGERTRDIPIERVIGGPAFRSSQDDDLLQMADLIAHALLKQEEEPSPRVQRLGIDRAFGTLDHALNRRASRTDPQGVVRR